MVNFTMHCAGCFGDFYTRELSEEGYCEACEYQKEANLDNLTDYEEIDNG